MKALVCENWCQFHELEIKDIPSPALPEKSVRIAVDSAGVSFAASLWVQGKYQRKPPLPFTPGTECTGTVLEVSPGVTRVKPGDRVMATLDWGGMAEEAIASEVCVFPAPKNISLAEAVSLPTSYATAYASLIWNAKLEAGETLLVFGAAGAVGLAAVQIGKAMGCAVIACASTEEKLNALRQAGADKVVNYTTENTRDKVMSFTNGKGVNVVFDPVGGEAFKTGLRSVAQEGRIVIIGFTSGDIPSIPANILMVKNVSVRGFNYGKYIGWGLTDEREKHADLVASWNAQLTRWCEQEVIKPTLHEAMPLENFRGAMELILGRRVIGKVVLQPNAQHSNPGETAADPADQFNLDDFYN